MNRNTVYALVGVLVVVVVLLVLLPFGRGNATTGADEPCVPSDAYTETVVITPAVPAVPGTPAVPAVTEEVKVIDVEAQDEVTHDEVVADQRYSWNPKGPIDESQDGPSADSTPLTDPDHWQANTSHYNGTDPIGVAFVEGRGNGTNNGSWFFWTGKTVTVVDTPAVEEESHMETIVVTPEVPATPGTPAVPAVTEEVTHPAVVCETPTETPTVNVPTETPTTNAPAPETPTVAPETPEQTPEEETPVATPNNPDKDKDEPVKVTNIPRDVQVIACVDGVWTISVNNEVISESGSCVVTPKNSVPQTFNETGL